MLSSSCSFRPHGARWRYCTTEPLCSFVGPLGQEPRPSPQGSNAQNGNCTRDLFLCCVDRRAHGCIQGLQGPRGLCHRWTRGLQAILHKCLPTCSSIQECARGAGEANLPAQAWDSLTARPGCTARLPWASPASSSTLDFPSIVFISDPSLPSNLNIPHALQEARGTWICSGRLLASGA